MGTIIDLTDSNHSIINPIDLEAVKMGDSFLEQRRQVNHQDSLAHQLQECKRTGRLANFAIAAGDKEGEISPHLAADSDVYKWLEAVAYDLATYEDLRLKEKADLVIDLIDRAQEDNGYLDTTFTADKKQDRWQDLDHGHELYCGGHLIQAAVAYHRATCEATLLEVAQKWADYIDELFGPEANEGTGGHPELEMALIELYRETGKQEYLELSRFFLEQRGQDVLGGSIYIQDHLPVKVQTTVEGHAVRQLYLLSGITDLYAENGDEELLATLKKQWHNFTDRKMAVTGGAGSRYHGEAFGLDFELPNRTGYYETCAAIASFMWNWRLLQVTGKARYADIMEQVLYNGLLSGVALDGMNYFYTNPLEHDGGVDVGSNHRGSNRRTSRHWDHTACCPPNMARTLGSLPGYIYGQNHEGIYVHHYTDSEVKIDTGETGVELKQETDYPWEGKIKINVNPYQSMDFKLFLRIPGWVEQAVIEVNNQEIAAELKPGEYAEIDRKWSTGDLVEIKLPMEINGIESHPHVSNNTGKIALKRGPIVYCIEGVDYPDIDIFDIVLSEKEGLESEYRKDLLGGVVVLTGTAYIKDHPDELYFKSSRSVEKEIEFRAVPYFSWANREPGPMRVWIPVE